MPDLDLSRWEAEYPLAGETVSGLRVREHIPNLSSIEASLTEWDELSGIREVPFSLFSGIDKRGPREKDLAQQIQASGEINPLIIVVDEKGPYILEGGHRYDALQIAGYPTFPALVVLDTEALQCEARTPRP